ncbi:MAG: low molecular weight protein arginine phosphatase [Elusimicrobiota bacterium]
MKVLFICTGNTCRSLMAQFLMNKKAADRGMAGWEARSAGVAAERYFQVPPGACRALAERGVAEISHTPQLVGREILGWADVVLPMTRGHREYLLDEYPEFGSKVRLFSEAAGWGERDVEDPIGQPDAAYRRCRDLLEEGLESIIGKHVPEKH